uniref:Ubiquitin-like protease family profile domain-containing protein n=1 Tax=Magallana gigas TaxID=29159 RepID=K1RAN2_MAGGI
MDFGFHSPVTTTNGVESLNKSLKHFYLKLANPGTLSTLMRVVIQDFLPDLFQNYVMLNYRHVVNLDIDGGADAMSDGDVRRESREGSLQVDCKRGKKKAKSLKLNKKKQEKYEEHSDVVVVEENVKEIKAFKLVMKLWSLKEDNDIPVAKVGGKNVCDTDIRSLRPGQWLTDMVMDSYLSLLALAQTDMGKKVVDFVHTKMTSIIEGSFRIKKRDGSRKNMKEIEELNADIILGTYYRSSHWTLVVVEELQMTLREHMSSRKMLPGIGMHYMTHVLMKEAIVLCVCLRTGLPLEEADKRCKETETSMRRMLKKNK